jgi:hypothetical protein
MRSVRTGADPGYMYAVVGCLDSIGCNGPGYVRRAVQFLLGWGMDARRASTYVSEPTVGKDGVKGRYFDSLSVRGACRCRSHRGKGAMGITMA